VQKISAENGKCASNENESTD